MHDNCKNAFDRFTQSFEYWWVNGSHGLFYSGWPSSIVDCIFIFQSFMAHSRMVCSLSEALKREGYVESGQTRSVYVLCSPRVVTVGVEIHRGVVPLSARRRNEIFKRVEAESVDALATGSDILACSVGKLMIGRMFGLSRPYIMVI